MDNYVGKTVSIKAVEAGQWLAGQVSNNYVYLSTVQDPNFTSWTVEKDPIHYACYSFRLPSGHYLAGDGRINQMYLMYSKAHPVTTWVCSQTLEGSSVYMQLHEEPGSQTYSKNMYLTGQSNAIYLSEYCGSHNTQWLLEIPGGQPQPPQPPQPTPNPPQPPQPAPQPAKAFKSYEIDAELRKIPSLKNVVMPRRADPEYRSLDLATMQSIWQSSFLSKGAQLQQSENFDCDDFAFCMKAEVARYSQQNPGPTNSRNTHDGYLCGIFYAESPNLGGPSNAYNFYITANGNIEFFDPMSGTQIQPGEWNPFFSIF